MVTMVTIFFWIEMQPYDDVIDKINKGHAPARLVLHWFYLILKKSCLFTHKADMGLVQTLTTI